MEPLSSAASASAVAAVVGASRVARTQRSRGAPFPDDIIALGVCGYVRYRHSYEEVSEWLAERGVLVDQSTLYRWVQRYLRLFGEVARKYRLPVSPDWRVEETSARIRGRWHNIFRAIDGHGQIVDAYVSPIWPEPVDSTDLAGRASSRLG